MFLELKKEYMTCKKMFSTKHILSYKVKDFIGLRLNNLCLKYLILNLNVVFFCLDIVHSLTTMK